MWTMYTLLNRLRVVLYLELIVHIYTFGCIQHSDNILMYMEVPVDVGYIIFNTYTCMAYLKFSYPVKSSEYILHNTGCMVHSLTLSHTIWYVLHSYNILVHWNLWYTLNSGNIFR